MSTPRPRAALRAPDAPALRLASAFLGATCVAFAYLWLDYREFWLDDSFITLRYARNLALGLGPVFNPGERVEGYTSFLWMLLCALPFAALPDALALGVVKASSLVLGLWVVVRCWSFPGPDGEPRRRLGVGLLASQPIFVANFGDGMETALYSALLLEVARAFHRPPSRGAGALTGALVAAAVWTRPETLPLLALLPLLWLLAYRGDPAAARVRRGWLAGFAAAGLGPVVLHGVWRFGFYGAWLPNTYHAKASGELSARVSRAAEVLRSLAFAHPFLRPPTLLLGAALACLAVLELPARLRRGTAPRALCWLGVLGGLVLFRVVFLLWSGGETMGVFRFLAPALAPLVVLADEGGRVLWRRGGERRWLRPLLAGACGFALLVNVVDHRAQADARGGYERGLAEAHTALGRWLRDRYPPDTLVAVGDAGAVPFFSQLPTLDLWGLNDATIAHLPGEFGARPRAIEYALGREPGVVVLLNTRPLRGPDGALQLAARWSFDHELFRHPDFGRSYRFVREFTFRPRRGATPGYYLDVFERRPAAAPRARDSAAAGSRLSAEGAEAKTRETLEAAPRLP